MTTTTRRAVRTITADLVLLSGVGLAVYGLWQWYQPIAWIAGGALLILLAVAILRR